MSQPPHTPTRKSALKRKSESLVKNHESEDSEEPGSVGKKAKIEEDADEDEKTAKAQHDEAVAKAMKLRTINSTQSPLLQLPAELRNNIYLRALGDPVQFFRTPKKHRVLASSSYKHFKRINNLERVCHQLRHETHKLELKRSSKYFIHGDIFRQMCEDKNVLLNDIKHEVELFGQMGLEYRKPDKTLLQDMIINFAWKNLKATIIVRVDELHFEYQGAVKFKTVPGFLAHAGTIQHAIRGDKFWPCKPDVLKKWSGNKGSEQLNAPNLRFFPRDKTFDEGGFRRKADKKGGYIKEVLPKCNNNLEIIIEKVRDWYEHGF